MGSLGTTQQASVMAKDPTDSELQALVAELTIDEKVMLLAGKNIWETHAIDRLNIPSVKLSDGPNGARGGSFYDGTTAACFPASVSLAATFNTDLAYRVGVALGQETITKSASALLGPTVCIHRSPLGGRNFEAFSEDPLLSGKLAAQYVKGLQSERVAATVKHFLANEQDTRRFSVNQTISERALREIFLRAFEIVVKEADPWCIMSSYPKINGAHVDAQPKFLKDVLRGEWGYNGLVMSDWGAVSNADKSVEYGLDLEMPGPPRHRTPEAVLKAVKSGRLAAEDIDRSTLQFLRLLRKVGKFTDRKEIVPEEAIIRPEHSALIREAGAEGIVLLKNSNKVLPLSKPTPKKIALLGPLAKVAAAHGGGSASLNCHYRVSPYDAFAKRLPDCELSYSKGCHIFRALPDLELGADNRLGNPGFIADFYKSLDLSGEVAWTEEYPRGYFTTLMNTNVAGCNSVRFSSTYTPATSGKHCLSFSGLGPSRFFINGELVSHQEKETRDSMGFLLGVQDEDQIRYDFLAGEKYELVIESIPSQVDNSELFLLQDQISVHLGFITQEEFESDLLAEAVELAKAADVAICFVGNTAQWETEGQDLSSMSLPADGSQDRLVAEIAKVNPNTIVVLATGVPVEMPWLDDVAAVLQVWYAGQETGNAILDVITGEVNPSGKLPVSWPQKYEHTGCYGNFGLDSFESREVEYVEGVNVGYRHFDRLYGTKKEVLFPFGYGLSYTAFELSNAELSGDIAESDPAAAITLSVDVTNCGDLQGAEAVQVYLAPPKDGNAGRPPQSLVAFDKVQLKAGEARTVRFSFCRDVIAYWDEAVEGWKVDAGPHEVRLSTSSHPRDVRARVAFVVREAFAF